ncbi:hypothetical protein Mapa_003594 [Marchantia paleacea]|nr:hypothetical protein Mapa_003594 [Marchantia paleacea]
MALRSFLFAWALLGLLVLVEAYSDDVDYYSPTCPQATSIVKEKVTEYMKHNKNLAGGFLRLHFHDCFVRGCDASVLLDSANNTAEKDAPGNAVSLRGFEEIAEIKSLLEDQCPGIVSCADIVALAARDAVVKVGGPSWPLALGRKDGYNSSDAETNASLPTTFMSFDQLVQNFAAVGLDEDEMVVLSGAHTIGRSTCLSVKNRLYEFDGVEGAVDPSLDSDLAEQLKKKCPQNEDGEILDMDPTKDTFDNLYYKAVLANKGIFHSDAQLLTNEVGKKLVTKYSVPGSSFSQDFAAAMVKMSNIQWNPQGEVRRICSAVNQ